MYYGSNGVFGMRNILDRALVWKFPEGNWGSTDGTKIDTWVSGVGGTDWPSDELQATWIKEYELSTAWSELRQTRDAKLAKSDYMGNSDVTMSSAWKTYRKALRDLPGTLNDTTVLKTITWPDEPS